MRADQDPAAERIATSNEAALRFRLRADGVADLADHAALQQFAAAQPQAFLAAIQAFAGVPAPAAALADALLEADLRPDDLVLVAGVAPPGWLATLAQVMTAPDGTTPATLGAAAAAARADVLVMPAAWRAADAARSGLRFVRAEGWSHCKPSPSAPSAGDEPP